MKAGIGIDMGGTRIKIGLVGNGKLIAATDIKASSHVSLQERLIEIEKEADHLLKVYNCTPTGVGLAFPGIVDSDQQKILSNYVKYPDARETNLTRWAEDHWSIPLVLENDARAALVGEWQYGAGRHCDNLVLVTLGTGVGTAVLINGELLRGSRFLAGNLGGHMTINIHGATCNCGNIGCLEAESSTWALHDRVTASPEFASSALFAEREINFNAIFKRAEEKDELAMKVKEDSLKAWAFGMINLIHAYDPERIVIGGGIMKSRDIVIPYMKQVIRRHSWLGDGKIDMVTAEQPGYAGILGVCHLLNNVKNSTNK